MILIDDNLHIRRQRCRVNGVVSDTIANIIGVSQGSCLGPLLCLRHMNDLLCGVSKAHVTMYADETAIPFSSNKIAEINTVVNAELACLEDMLQSNDFPLISSQHKP